MSRQKTAHCRRCGEELDPMTDDTERQLCIDCAEELEDEEYKSWISTTYGLWKTRRTSLEAMRLGFKNAKRQPRRLSPGEILSMKKLNSSTNANMKGIIWKR